MGQDPEQLRAEIAQTRAELGQDLDTLAEKVTPSKVVGRRVDATKERMSGIREKVMGSAGSAGGAVTSTAGSAAGTVAGAAGSTADTVTQAPAMAREKAAGNPFAAGVIAFGLGWLASSLIPASRAEQQGAGKLKDAAAEPVKETLSQAASEMKESLAPAAQDAVQSVKQTATDAASTVKEQAGTAGAQVKDQASSSAGTVADTAKSSAQDAKDQATSPPAATVPPVDDLGSVMDEPFPAEPEGLSASERDPLRDPYRTPPL
jgi:hypothetical protein